MARPPKLTDQLTDEIARLIRGSVTVTGAAQTLGISRSTFYAWMERGESAAAADAPYRRFRQAVETARAEGEAILVQRIQNAAAKGSWQAAAYLLEKRYDHEWGKPNHDRNQDTEGQAEAKPDRAREILDELAAKRERRGQAKAR